MSKFLSNQPQALDQEHKTQEPIQIDTAQTTQPQKASRFKIGSQQVTIETVLDKQPKVFKFEVEQSKEELEQREQEQQKKKQEYLVAQQIAENKSKQELAEKLDRLKNIKKGNNSKFAFITADQNLPEEQKALFNDADQLFQFDMNAFTTFGNDNDILKQVCEFRMEGEVRRNAPTGVDQETFESYCEHSKIKDPKEYMKERKAGVIPSRFKNKILGLKRDEQQIDEFSRIIKETLNKYSIDQFSQLKKAIQEVLKQQQQNELNTYYKELLIQLYDKAALEHKYITLYSKLINFIVFEYKKEVDILSIFQVVLNDYLKKEITLGKTPLPQYKTPEKSNQQTIMLFNNNYDLHFKGCSLLIANLFTINPQLIDSQFMVDTLYTVLLRDLKTGDQDREVERFIKDMKSQDQQDQLIRKILAKTRREKSEYIVHSIAMFELIFQQVLSQQNVISICKINAFDQYLQQLTTDIVDSLIIYKIKQCKTNQNNISSQARKQQITLNIQKDDFKKILDQWDAQGIVEVVKSIIGTSDDDLIIEKITNNNRIKLFIDKIFANNQQQKLIKDKFKLFQKIKSSKQAEDFVLEAIVLAFVKNYNPQINNEQFFDLAIEYCLKKEYFIYTIINQLDSSNFLLQFIHFTIVKAYTQVFEEYEGLFEESDVQKVLRDIENKNYSTTHNLPEIYKIFAQNSYSYFNEPDFKQFAAKCTTKFEDDAIKFISIIFTSKTGFNTQNKNILSEKMKILTKFSPEGIKIVGSLKSILTEANFLLGICAFPMFSTQTFTEPRSYFYIQKKILQEVVDSNSLVDFNQSLKEGTPVLKSFFPTISLFALENLFEMTVSQQNSAQKMLQVLNSLYKVRAFDKATMNANLVKMNQKGDQKWGIYKFNEFK